MAAKVYGDRWEIVRPIGEGGQAHVYEVRDVRGAAPNCVLKRLKNPKRVARFRTELEAVRRIDHPNVIQVVDADLDGEVPYLVLELVAQGSLRDHLGRYSSDPVAALRFFTAICRGVAEAHTRSIVHRDLKPDNILIRACGSPVVSDFGICHVEDGERQTLTEEAVGPRLYMAPELEGGRSEQVRPWSDVYSLGKLLYAIMSGGSVFARERHREEQFDLVERTGLDSLEHVNRLLDRMVALEPSDRFADAGAVLERLERVINLVTYDYRAVSARRQQRCVYCGEGTYRTVVRESPIAVGNFGFQAVGRADWRILVCEECGHVSSFRVDYAKRKDWWEAE